RGLDLRGVEPVHGDNYESAQEGGAAGNDEEMLPRACATLLAVRQEVDASHHDGSNLRMARPQTTMSEGASTIKRLSGTREDVCIAANGLATAVGTCVLEFTTASNPGMTAEPPASRIWSMVWYCVEVKKNCSARCTSVDRFSMKGRSTSASKSSGRPPERLAASASSALI